MTKRCALCHSQASRELHGIAVCDFHAEHGETCECQTCRDRTRVAKAINDDCGGHIASDWDPVEFLIHPDPEFPDVFAARVVIPPSADLENGPHPDDVGYNMDFLVVLDEDNPRYGVEEVEWETWPPAQAKSLDPFNL